MSSISLEGLTKRFGDFVAVDSLDLRVENGEFLALLGPSGCGKSTTMNMICGMLRPTEGRILFGERDVVDVDMGQRKVGFVFQTYAIFTHMTVRQNLEYGLRMQNLPKAEVERRTLAMAELLQLTPLLDSRTSKLSVNILQRIAIGRSAIIEPAIFLLDEPLSNVDAAFRAVMRTELKGLQRQFGQTMVYVTHDQLEAMTMADRIAVMDQGVLQQVDTPLDIYNKPRNLFVARFIGSPGMNLFAGRLTEENGRVIVDLGAAGRPVLAGGLGAAARKASRGEVVLGIRPEDLTAQRGGKGDMVLDVVLIERVGNRAIVHLEGRGHAAKMVADADFQAGTGESLPLVLNPARLRLFDAHSGLALYED
jgi:multiple sugar transport system ATP-binding protein